MAAPRRLLQLYYLISVIGMVVVLALAYQGTYLILKDFNLRKVESNAVSMVSSIWFWRGEHLLDPTTGDLKARIPAGEIQALDRVASAYRDAFGLRRIKLFTLSGLVAYSDDASIIGRQDRLNSYLESAFNNQVVSKVEEGHAPSDLHGELGFDVAVVETYVPLTDYKGAVVGVAEVYLDTTTAFEEVSAELNRFVLLIGILMLLIFTVLSLFMSRGTRKLQVTQSRLETQASRDALTGLYNRGFLEEWLSDQLARSKEAGQQGRVHDVGVVLLDLDYFKQVNDRFGHLVGDQVLIAFARRLESLVRGEDIVGRFGGEEFLVLLPRTHPQGAEALARKLWQGISGTPLEVNGKDFEVTVSIGVSSISPGDLRGDEVLGRADRALYRVKESGRNNFMVEPADGSANSP